MSDTNSRSFSLASLRGKRVLVVGDAIVDEFVHGETRRISPEAPVPVVSVTHTEVRPGGAANVSANIATLGGEPILASVVGSDSAAELLRHALVRLEVSCEGLFTENGRDTPHKRRIISQSQQLLRIDIESEKPVSLQAEHLLLAWVAKLLPTVDACIVSDYDKGVVTTSSARELIEQSRQLNVPVIVDSKRRDYSLFRGAAVLTPNLREFQNWIGEELSSETAIAEAADRTITQLGLAGLLVTRGADGMSLFTPGRSLPIPADVRDVFDVTGAGDTVVACLTLARAAGWSLDQAARLANAAASISISKLGTATVSSDDLQRALNYV